MSRMRQGYLLRGVAILIAAVFSGAWTFSVAGIGGLATVTAEEETAPAGLPDGTSMPVEAIDAPASLSDPAELTGGNSASVISASATNAIPSAALAAYQRAETVINKADPSCNLTWQLVAAIGRVESNHGRVHGNVLDTDGVASPGIYGPALNGTGGVKAIRDTDGGQYDADARWDRAVGPMQFIPSTWSVVGVDADGDGVRNPQDIDDAALAAAVYLCSGEDDLSTLEGQKASVFRYNNSDSYVALVLKIMEQYLAGNYTSVSGTTTAGGYVVPDPTYTPPPAYNPPKGDKSKFNVPDRSGSKASTGGGDQSTGGDDQPNSGGTTDDTGGDNALPGDKGGTGALTETTKKVTDGLKEGTKDVPVVGEVVKGAADVVTGLVGTLEQATVALTAPLRCVGYANDHGKFHALPLTKKQKSETAAYNAAYKKCMDSYGL